MLTPGSPSSPFSTTPGLPPPGLKSRQTTPLICPDCEAGVTACFAPPGTSCGAMPVSPSSATPPGCRGVLSRSPPPCGCSGDVEGSALERTPGGVTASETTRPSALIAPVSGFWSYRIRQVTPVAKAEMAMGRKTTVLNASDQRIRSVRTAKMSPIAATNAGTTATQIALFLIAVVKYELVKSVL